MTKYDELLQHYPGLEHDNRWITGEDKNLLIRSMERGHIENVLRLLKHGGVLSVDAINRELNNIIRKDDKENTEYIEDLSLSIDLLTNKIDEFEAVL